MCCNVLQYVAVFVGDQKLVAAEKAYRYPYIDPYCHRKMLWHGVAVYCRVHKWPEDRGCWKKMHKYMYPHIDIPLPSPIAPCAIAAMCCGVDRWLKDRGHWKKIHRVPYFDPLHYRKLQRGAMWCNVFQCVAVFTGDQKIVNAERTYADSRAFILTTIAKYNV